MSENLSRTIREMCLRAKEAQSQVAACDTLVKNRALEAIADALCAGCADILAENSLDLSEGEQNGINEVMLDRLRLTRERIYAIASGVREIAALRDPIGEVGSMEKRPGGLLIGKMRVPLGVIGAIYESRPNVTCDIAALALKSGNACILRGGKEAKRSNFILADIMRSAVQSVGLSPDLINIVRDVTRESASEMMKARGYIDLLIPRGGKGLIESVVLNSRVPVIETGYGVCHVYVDEGADLEMAANIIYNAKTSRPSVCNAAETLLVARSEAKAFLPMAKARLDEKNVLLYGDAETREILGDCVLPAGDDEYYAEFLDYKLAVRVVDGIDEAMRHIAKYGSSHSEAIITRDYARAREFLQRVDSAAVYVNASTRFTDGGVFGLGAEVGISTQKLHARGPFALEALTSSKYIIYGNGQIRE